VQVEVLQCEKLIHLALLNCCEVYLKTEVVLYKKIYHKKIYY